MDKSIPLEKLVTASYWPWRLADAFEVHRLNNHTVSITPTNSVTDDITRDAVLRDVATKMTQEGFSAFPYNRDIPVNKTNELLSDSVRVSVVWAEEKISGAEWVTDMSSEINPNSDRWGILATGPLVRKNDKEPRRVVLRKLDEGAAYVVQVQVIPDGMRNHFFQGNQYIEDAWRNRRKAVETFILRIIEVESD